MTYICRYLLLTFLMSLSCLSTAYAATVDKDGPSTSEAIVAFFNESYPVKDAELTLSESDRLGFVLMSEVIESVVNSDDERLRTAVRDGRTEAATMSETSLDILEFAEGVLDITENAPRTERFERLREYLTTHQLHNSWYIESISQSLSAFILVTRNETAMAAQHLDQAMNGIPTELSDWATGARLLASEVATALHGLQGNPAFMLEAARLQREAKAEIGETINRYELMTNFVYAFNRVRDFESAADVAELLLAEPRPEEMIGGLSEVYVAQTYIELERYEAAKDLAKRSLELTEHPHIRQRAQFAYLVASAGLGQQADARAMMDAHGHDYSRRELLNTVTAEAVIHAEALLAMHRGDAAFALALMKRRADLIITRVQNANSLHMTSMLSNLENTRGRQLERETALQREAELKAVQLEQQTKMNRLLWVLLAVLTIAFNLLLAFLRYREKNNRKVQALQKDALSAEKMKTEFLGIVNHELRTPLNGIIGISDAMIHNAEDPTLKAQAEAVQESGQLLFDLLDSLITMSTIEGDRLTLATDEADLSRAITDEAESWEATARTKGLAYSHFVAPEVGTLLIGDKKRIRQCVRFLLSNAVRFTHEGRIHLHATVEPDGPKHMTLSLIVADTGQGISETVQQRLFKPFLQADSTMTRKYGGAGLSLAIARKLARMMGGDLTVTSREGRGSEFHFTARLPRADAYTPDNVAETEDLMAVQSARPVTQAPAPTGLDELSEPEDIIDLMLDHQLFDSAPDNSATDPSDMSSLKLLVGDDMTLQTSGLRAALKSLRCRTVPADNADMLMQSLQRQNFDVVIVNLRASALGGTDTVARIRSLAGPMSTVPVIALDQAGRGRRATQDSSDIDLVLTHPVTEDELVAALERLLRARQAA